MGRRRKLKAKPLLYPVELIDHPVSGAEGHRVKVGRTMHVPPYDSPNGFKVPRRVGVVARIYKREGDERTLVDLHRHGATFTVEASRCQRSAACGVCFGSGKDAYGTKCSRGCRGGTLEFEAPPSQEAHP